MTTARILRPDVIVKLPGNKSIVIDAKVSLSGYLRAHEEGADDEARRAGMADHARQVRDHVQRLSQKAYWRQLPDTPDFVVMFMHDESSLAAALDRRPGAVRAALANHVILATPTTLIAVLRAAHYGWQQERIAESAREISDLGRELYKRLSTMGAHVSKLGRSLDGAVKSYNETVGLARAAGAAAGAAVRAARDHRHRAARARADRPPDAGAERPGARRVTPPKAPIPLEIRPADASAA